VRAAPSLTVDALPDKFWKYYHLYQSRQITLTDIAKLMDCSRTTIYKYIEMAEETV